MKTNRFNIRLLSTCARESSCLMWREFWGISLLERPVLRRSDCYRLSMSALFFKECCFLSPLLVLVEKSPKLCVLNINNLIQSQRFFDFSSSLGLSAAFGSDVRLRSVRKISNLHNTNMSMMNRNIYYDAPKCVALAEI